MRTGCSTPLMSCRTWNGFLLANDTPAYASGACRHGHGQAVPQLLCMRLAQLDMLAARGMLGTAVANNGSQSRA